MSRVTMQFRIPTEIKDRLQAVAHGRNMTAMVMDALLQWLAQEEKALRP